MVQQNVQIRPNSADETIQVGVIQIRFLVTGAESNGNAAIFELTIPAGARQGTSREAFPITCEIGPTNTLIRRCVSTLGAVDLE
jgi:hypothetical protein